MAKALDTNAIALELTAKEEQGALFTAIAWTVAAMNMVEHWNVKANAPRLNRGAAIKALREKYAYHIDVDGDYRLNDKGQRMKRSAVYDKLVVSDKIFMWIEKSAAQWKVTFQEAVIQGNKTAYNSGLAALGAELSKEAGGAGLKAIEFWLDHRKPKAEAAKAEAAKADDTKQSGPVADPVAGSGSGDGLSAEAALMAKALDVAKFLGSDQAQALPDVFWQKIADMAAQRLAPSVGVPAQIAA